MRPETMARIRRHREHVRFAAQPSPSARPRCQRLSCQAARCDERPASNKGARSPQAAFREFIETLWPLAEARGVSRATFDSAFAGVSFDPKVAAIAESQPEFVRPIWDYVTQRRVA